jgi:hypothetical protein
MIPGNASQVFSDPGTLSFRSILEIAASGIPLNSVTAWIVPMWPYYAATGFLPSTAFPWGRLGSTAVALSCLLIIWAAQAFRKSK